MVPEDDQSILINHQLLLRATDITHSKHSIDLYGQKPCLHCTFEGYQAKYVAS